MNNGYIQFKTEWILGFEKMLEDNPKFRSRIFNESLLKTVRGDPLQTWWLSFVDPDLPEGKRFLGAIIIDAVDFPDAHCRTHFLKINPGGEIQGLNISCNAHRINPADKNRLLTKEEAMAYDELD